MSFKKEILHIAVQAQKASRYLATLSTEQKNKALKAMAESLLKGKQAILKANKKDIEFAKLQKSSVAFIERLTLDDSRIKK